MRYWRKIFGLAISTATAFGISAGFAGTANASIVNDAGYIHVQNARSGQCLMADPDTLQVKQWRCLNAPSEEWKRVPVSFVGIPNSGGYVLINEWISKCMAVPNWPSNGTKIVLAACDALDTRQYWTNISAAQSPYYRTIAGQGSQTLCLDKPSEADNQGLQIQTWACASQDPHWNPFFDYHTEQWWKDL